jgi:ferrous iron transport protein B
LALLAWYVIAPQCASILGVGAARDRSWKWIAFLFGYMLALAYLAALITYHTAVLLGAG